MDRVIRIRGLKPTATIECRSATRLTLLCHAVVSRSPAVVSRSPDRVTPLNRRLRNGFSTESLAEPQEPAHSMTSSTTRALQITIYRVALDRKLNNPFLALADSPGFLTASSIFGSSCWASCSIAFVMRDLGACSNSGIPLLRDSTIET